MVHPDAAFLLGRWGYTRHCLLEFERRAITPKRIRARLTNYQRYFRSGWSVRDHGEYHPLVLFVFENARSEKAFLRVAAGVEIPSLLTSNNDLINRRGVLGEVWCTSAQLLHNRVTLGGYVTEDKIQPTDPGDSCREYGNKPDNSATYVVKPLLGHGGDFVAVSGDTTVPEESPVLAVAETVG